MKQFFKVVVIALAMLCSFSQMSEAKVKKTNKPKTQKTTSTKASWNVTSASELKKRLIGTIWTCRPSDGLWHRVEFKNDKAFCSILNPYDKCWFGTEANPYEVTNEISISGEKYIRVQFIDPDTNRPFNFFNMNFLDGKAYLRHGKSYAEAENKDFKP